MRDLSTNIQNILESDTHNAYLAVDITLSEGTYIRAAEIELDVTSVNLFGTSVGVDTVAYPALLKQEPQIKFSRGKAPSGGGLSIIDLDHILGVEISQVETLLDNARIVITVCFEKPDYKFEADIYFIGNIRDVKVEDEVTTFNVIADTDNRTTFVANRSLTQRCLAVYGDNRCRRPASLMFPGDFCSNVFDDAEHGCLAHRWQFAYWGIPILELISDFSSGNGWGDGTVVGGGGCPTLEMFLPIVDSKGNLHPVRVSDLKTGMLTTDSQGRVTAIDYLEILPNQPVRLIEAANGARLRCSETHPIITDIFDNVGTKAVEMKTMQKCLTQNIRTKQSENCALLSNVADGLADVMRICLSNGSNAIYGAGADGILFIDGHNNKYHNTVATT